MERTRIGQAMMALGAILVLGGLISLATGGDDSPGESNQPVSTTTSAVATTVAPVTTAAPTTLAATTTTTSPTTTTQPPETAADFLTELNVAFESSDADFLLARLNEAVIERYGADQCVTYLAGILPQSQGLSMRREVGVAQWDYVTDDVVTSLAGVSAIEVDRVVNGETRINELHWQMVDGVFTWFTDCGTPVTID